MNDNLSDEMPPASMSVLPEEILSIIINFLDSDPPSITRSDQVPSCDLLFVEHPPLKSASQLNQAWRRIALPLLLRCIRVNLEDVLPVWQPPRDSYNEEERPRLCFSGFSWTNHDLDIQYQQCCHLLFPRRAQSFFEFIDQHGLGGKLHSLAVFSSKELDFTSENCPGTIGKSRAASQIDQQHQGMASRKLWGALFARLNPDVLVIFTPPKTLGCLATHCVINNTDAWAFNIHCQRLELRRRKSSRKDIPTVFQRLDRDHGNIDSEPYTGNAGPLNRAQWTQYTDVIAGQPWTEVSYHGGSCLPAYGTYHYFEKMPPCFLTQNPFFTNILGPKLTHFSYKIVFAHVTHFRRIISLILRFESLKSLSLQLTPTEDSDTLDNYEAISKGNLRLQDCWNETEQCYLDVVRTVLRKDPVPVLECLASFTSFDCRKGAFKEELEAAMEKDAPSWRKTGEFTWEVVDDAVMGQHPVEASTHND